MEGGKLIKNDNTVPTSYPSSNNKGAKLLASGSSSCVFYPNIPCKGSNDVVSKEKISKIVYGKKSDKYLNQEKKVNNLIRAIKGFERWALIYDKYCKAPDYGNIFKNYDKDIVDCMDDYYEDKFNTTNNMMIGTYGGITLDDYFIENILKNKSTKTIDKQMYILLKKMEPLFIGLNELYKNKISHLDIKVNNIVLHEKKFKYIDFGLSSKLSDRKHFEERGLSEFQGARFYLWYPIEYIYSCAEKTSLEYETSKIKKRKHFDKGDKIFKLFDIDFEESIKQIIKNKKPDQQQLNSMIDTYSVGILIPYLFTDFKITKSISKSVFLKDIFSLFSRMCSFSYNDRIKPPDALKVYYSLINKYALLEKGTTKRTMKKNSSKSKKRKKSKKVKSQKFKINLSNIK